MWIIGCDWHTRYEQIAAMETTTGELMERRVELEGGQAEKFYAALPQPVRVRMEATGTTQWFESLLARLGHELWVGDAAAIRAAVVRQQKTDTRDAQRLGAISKQGNTLVRWLLVEAAQTAARLDPELHGYYVRLKFRLGARIAKVAIARKLQ
jgi:transposase